MLPLLLMMSLQLDTKTRRKFLQHGRSSPLHCTLVQIWHYWDILGQIFNANVQVSFLWKPDYTFLSHSHIWASVWPDNWIDILPLSIGCPSMSCLPKIHTFVQMGWRSVVWTSNLIKSLHCTLVKKFWNIFNQLRLQKLIFKRSLMILEPHGRWPVPSPPTGSLRTGQLTGGVVTRRLYSLSDSLCWMWIQSDR